MVSLISLYPLASSRRSCDGGRVELRLTLVFLSLLLSQTQKLAFEWLGFEKWPEHVFKQIHPLPRIYRLRRPPPIQTQPNSNLPSLLRINSGFRRRRSSSPSRPCSTSSRSERFLKRPARQLSGIWRTRLDLEAADPSQTSIWHLPSFRCDLASLDR
ncbi:hypothetical protein BDY24DRAFT_30250 [Mrakia frigida]|uniref:uncharacterized protein n=1 Tax=Mrakia frigida TaxID=29902 RepID=UPI003FCC0540